MTEISSKICQHFTELDVEPRNSHEKEIVSSSSLESITENRIASANALLCNLQQEKQSNTQTGLQIIDKIQTIAAKLHMNYSANFHKDDLCSYKTIGLVS